MSNKGIYIRCKKPYELRVQFDFRLVLLKGASFDYSLLRDLRARSYVFWKAVPTLF